MLPLCATRGNSPKFHTEPLNMHPEELTSCQIQTKTSTLDLLFLHVLLMIIVYCVKLSPVAPSTDGTVQFSVTTQRVEPELSFVSTANEAGETPLDIAKRLRHTQCEELVRRYTACVYINRTDIDIYIYTHIHIGFSIIYELFCLSHLRRSSLQTL